MNKPEIIGCKPNPDATEAQQRRREQFTYGVSADGFWMESTHADISIHRSDTRRIRANMFALGLRPVYAPRDCYAVPYFDGYAMICKQCNGTWTAQRLPHDSATNHLRVCWERRQLPGQERGDDN